MEELDIATVTRRSIQGVFAFVTRSFLIQLITIVANFLLTIYLTEQEYGIFFIVSAAIAFLTYFSDIGLAAALIQKKEEITDEELKTTFTIQQILVGVAVLIALLLSGEVGKFYNLQSDGVLLFQALVISFFLSSLKTIPSVLLERKLQFQRLVIPQIIETTVYNIILIYTAINGYGIMSFTYAVLARGIVGLIAMYIIKPWIPGISFSKSTASRLLKFGVPFQANSFLALLKDDLLTIYLGKVLPFGQIGYIAFAQKYAFQPLRLVMDNIIRITFPSFSRLSDDKEYLGKAIEKTLLATSLVIFPSLVGMVIMMPHFIDVIPRYEKWEPALLALTFFAINAGLSSISTPLTNALNAMGKVKTTLYLMVFWTVTTWVLTPIAIMLFGFNGVAGVSALVATSVVLVIHIMKRHVSFRVLPIIFFPLLASLVMGASLFMMAPLLVTNVPTFILTVLIGAIIYVGVLLLTRKDLIMSDARFILTNLRK
jgi:O-antigen/teichoic acid export membrane protein